MAEVLIDPYLVMVPQQNASGEELMGYLSRLGQWTRLITDSDHHFWFSEPALDALSDSGGYPFPDKLTNLISRADVDFCDISTVSRAFEILYAPPYLDGELAISNAKTLDVLPDEANTVVIPEQIAERLHPNVADGLRVTLSKLAYCQQFNLTNMAAEMMFATSDLAGNPEYIDVHGNCYQGSEDQYITVTGKWPAITSPEYITPTEELIDFWQDTRRAVLWAYRDLIERRELDPKTHVLLPGSRWCVGGHFNGSIQENHLDRTVKLTEIFHAVVKVLIGYWGKLPHDHNKPIKRGAEQVERYRDGGLAWRAHVTNQPDRVRLHYWIVDGKSFELANVVLRNDLNIEQD